MHINELISYYKETNENHLDTINKLFDMLYEINYEVNGGQPRKSSMNVIEDVKYMAQMQRRLLAVVESRQKAASKYYSALSKMEDIAYTTLYGEDE